MLPNRFFTLAVIMSLVVVIALTVREAVTTSAIALDPEALEVHSLERSRAADTARWTAMGEYYENLEAAQLQRSRTADTARWEAMGEYYLNQSRRERSQAADTARWTAMGEYYGQLEAAQLQRS